MIKVVAIETFALEKFDELRDIERADEKKNQHGFLYVNDKFKCTESMYNYLTKENKLNRPFVKEAEKEEKTEKIEKTTKPKKRQLPKNKK